IGVGGDIRGPAISQARYTAQDSLWGLRVLTAAHAKPDGDRALHRQGIQAGMGNVMPVAVEVNDLLRPQGPQHSNLLGAPASSGVEVLVQGFIFDLVPAHANAKPQAAPTEHVDFRRLLRD